MVFYCSQAACGAPTTFWEHITAINLGAYHFTEGLECQFKQRHHTTTHCPCTSVRVLGEGHCISVTPVIGILQYVKVAGFLKEQTRAQNTT